MPGIKSSTAFCRFVLRFCAIIFRQALLLITWSKIAQIYLFPCIWTFKMCYASRQPRYLVKRGPVLLSQPFDSLVSLLYECNNLVCPCDACNTIHVWNFLWICFRISLLHIAQFHVAPNCVYFYLSSSTTFPSTITCTISHCYSLICIQSITNV